MNTRLEDYAQFMLSPEQQETVTGGYEPQPIILVVTEVENDTEEESTS